MRVLFLKNVETEGPGTIAGYLNAVSVPYRIVDLKDSVQDIDIAPYSALVMLGGPMGVYEMDSYDRLKTGARLLEKAIKGGKKVLCVCLGSQMLAHVLGARVYKGHVQEKGWLEVQLTGEGQGDPVFGCLGNKDGRARVLQWHGDTFDLPAGAARLAGSKEYENQAFKYGSGVYALQFHIEADPIMISDWFEKDPAVMADTSMYFADCASRAVEFYTRFFG